MKLTGLFLRARKRARDASEIDPAARLANDRADRSSMAELVRLLQQHDEAQRDEERPAAREREAA